MSTILRLFLVLCFACGSAASVAWAHEVRPAYLELREEPAGEFAVLWKVPARGELRLSLEPRFSGENLASTAVARAANGASVETWVLHASELRGQTLTIAGLESTMTDVLARIEFADGSVWTQRLNPASPSAVIPTRQSAFAVAGIYIKLGIEHILLGIDHLLFVLVLLIITQGTWRLVKTVTAFTVAHSITLGVATLGYVHVPAPPVEAAIALSIAFVAAEILRTLQGQQSFTARAPWIVAFAFGLLHGFGFAGALSEIGLPEGQIPVALLFFNVGVEIGQLLFIAGVLACLALLRQARIVWPRWLELAPPYAIGTIATFWVIERIAAF